MPSGRMCVASPALWATCQHDYIAKKPGVPHCRPGQWNNEAVAGVLCHLGFGRLASWRSRMPSSVATAVPERDPYAIPPGAASAARRQHWLDAFRAVRQETERRAAPLSDEDQLVQSMPDASPIKWHRAHTTWFFEQFVLAPHLASYRTYDSQFAFLFNSYYVAAGPRHVRPKRGLLTRPNAADVTRYRAHVDAAIANLFTDASPPAWGDVAPLVEIGLHHEQQHQELMLTDILHAFSENPTAPLYDSNWNWPQCRARHNDWCELPEGIHTVGHGAQGFCFDNETPAHRALVGPVRVARNLVTNGEWLAFMHDDVYARPELWLSDG